MSPHRLGYACINMTLGGDSVPKKQRVTTNRTCRLATAQAKGLPHIASLVASNVRDLHTILQWNEAHDIRLFRMSSEMFSNVFWACFGLFSGCFGCFSFWMF